MANDLILKTQQVSVHYGGVHALSDVDLEVGVGQLVGLIGPNGAGKTTFIDAVTGFTPSSGEILFEDTDVSLLAPHARAARGLTRTWQSTELFEDLTVAENLVVASLDTPSIWGALRETLTRPKNRDGGALELLDRFNLTDMAYAMPDELAHGQRKLVGVLRALARGARMICLDEPAAGLDTYESEELGQRLRTVASAGTTLLLVDHDMGLVLGICDYVYVLDFGVIISHGTPEQVRNDARVVTAYLGRSAGTI